jgi:predicted TIM-barrel fold metal-dependent hydrolase
MVRAVDFHVHPSIAEWLEGSIGPMLEATAAYFHSEVRVRTAEQMAAEYRGWGLIGVLLGWDAETATGLPPLSNDRLAEICRAFPEQFVGFAGVDPHKPGAPEELERAVVELGLRGLKLHPQVQAFYPDDLRFEPLWEVCERHSLPVVVHVGQTGLGAGVRGGSGIAYDYGRPMCMDAVAARHPGLTVVMAHFGYPWHLEVLASALHKTNVWVDLSGWRPRYIPLEVKRDARGRLSDRCVWGSDYPMLDPGRILDEIDELELGAAATDVLRNNAARLLGLELPPAGPLSSEPPAALR